jgi:hypothetical protein
MFYNHELNNININNHYNHVKSNNNVYNHNKSNHNNNNNNNNNNNTKINDVNHYSNHQINLSMLAIKNVILSIVYNNN